MAKVVIGLFSLGVALLSAAAYAYTKSGAIPNPYKNPRYDELYNRMLYLGIPGLFLFLVNGLNLIVYLIPWGMRKIIR